jgi:hypothetical protein
MSMNPTQKPYRGEYLRCLEQMGAEGRLLKAIELSDVTRRMLRDAIAARFPDATASEQHRIFLERLAQCRNKNY